MCGIAGYYAFGKNLPSKDVVKKLFIGIESRGKDASGFAWIKKDRLMVCKAPITSSKMVETEEWKNFSIPRYAIFHARASTRGSETNNQNNHPIYNKMGLAVIHNGVISNDDYLFREHKIEKRDGEVDSEIILSLLEKGGNWDDGMKLMDELWGSFACASIDARREGEMLLWRHSNPLACAYDQDKDILYFASTENILRYGLRERNKRGFYITPNSVHIWEMADDYGMLISHKGRIREYVIDTKGSKWENVYSDRLYNCYEWSKDKDKDKNKKQICDLCGKPSDVLFGDLHSSGYICPKCKTKEEREEEIALSCQYCGRTLDMNDSYGDGKCSHCGRYALGATGYMDY